MKQPKLYIFSGLPASGKTPLAQMLSKHITAVYLRIDTVEQALLELCDFNAGGEGYRLSYRVAKDNLKLGLDVIADSCNPINLTRKEWREVAFDSGAEAIDIEVSCSCQKEHFARVENRESTIPNMHLPDWEAIQNREYHNWNSERILLETSGKSPLKSFNELLDKLTKLREA